MSEFIHLHNHTEYSLLDGCARIDKLVETAKANGASAVAITDHGNMYGAIKFYKKCKAMGIKPIVGCEVYLCKDRYNKVRDKINNRRYHLVLLAKNLEGFHNLGKISSKGFTEGFYERPRVDFEVIKEFSKNLICLSGCIAGPICQILLEETPDCYQRAKEMAIELRDMFDEGDFYIEVQNHFIKDEQKVLPLLYKIADEIGVKTVATNDLHYIEKKDSKAHDVLLCIQTASNYNDPNRFRFPNNNFYYKTYEEMKEIIPNEESLTNTLEVANKCNLEIIFNDYTIPVYIPPKGYIDDKDYLRKMTIEGLIERYGEITPTIEARMEKELETVISMGFASYYLIVWDFINYAKEHDIPVGAGRGSGVGSIIAYAIKITNVDPLKYDLLFERFLNKERQSMPDFDIDFCSDRREEVIEYVRNKYGLDHVAQIITFGKMKKKNAIKNVARVFEIPFAEANALVKNITNDDKKVHISNLLDATDANAVPELINMYEKNAQYKEILDLAIELEDMPRDRGKHAAGVIICSVPVMEKVPLSKNGDDITTQFDMTECEELGLLKMDFLAIKTLTDIKMATDFVEKYENIKIDFDVEGYADQGVFKMIGDGETDTVFQLESGGMKDFMKQLRPTLFEEIIAGVSLYRPGPMDYIPRYVKNKKNQERIDYRHPKLEPILKSTYGVIVYQEQAMLITQALAGYSLNKADSFRKFISKKKKDQAAQQKADFTKGCIANGVDPVFVEVLWKELEEFGSYAFNKSHAAAYSVLTYQTAYLKHYYPVEYLCAVINNRITNPDDTSRYLKLISDIGMQLLPPDINHSEGMFLPENGKIRYGLVCIKNVGGKAVNNVVNERNINGPYVDFIDFCRRIADLGVNKKMLECLIMGGAFDCFDLSRATLLANYEDILLRETSTNKLMSGGQMFFDFIVEDTYNYRIVEDDRLERLMQEKEVAGRYITGHPLDGHAKEFEEFKFNTSMLNPIEEEPLSGDSDDEEDNSANDDDKKLKYLVSNGDNVFFGGYLGGISIKTSKKTGRKFGFGFIEDLEGTCEISFFEQTYEKYKALLVNDTLVKILGRVSIKDDKSPQITIMKVLPFILVDEDLVVDDRELLINAKDEISLEKIYKILIENKSESGSIVKIQKDKKLHLIAFKVSDLDNLKYKISEAIGYENVKLK
ncbi:MAG: DNA polymerase III subunit alpha [Clostridia bacterium]